MRILETLERWAGAKNIIAWLLVAVVTGAIMSLGITPQVYAIIGDLSLLDTRFFYTFDEVVNLFIVLGPEGLVLYTYQKIVDMVFPLGYALPMAMIQVLLNRRAAITESIAPRLVMLPILGMILDYVENILIAAQIFLYPSLSESIVLIASIATALKWCFLGASFVTIIITLLLSLLRSKRRS